MITVKNIYFLPEGTCKQRCLAFYSCFPLIYKRSTEMAVLTKATVYLFNCNGDDKLTASVSENFITTSSKENIVGDKFKENVDANIDFDFDKDFQATPSIPDDQITADSSCSILTFDELTPTVINNRCDHNGNDDKTSLITVIR